MNQTSTHLKVKDHSVSGEEFELRYNAELDLLETFPQPVEVDLLKYYQSEDYISHTDSRRNLFEKAYHFIREISLKRKLKLINSLSINDKRLLDVGCGTGDFLLTAMKDGWTISGIEPDEKARAIANDKTNDSVFDIAHLHKFERHSFDVISLWHVLEHLPKPEEHIKILKSLLKPDGRLIIAVPNYNSHDAKFYKEFWAAYDVPRHFWHFSQTAVSKLFGRVHIEVEKTLPMKFDAYYVSLLSEKYKSGWMNIFRAFLIGFTSNLKASSTKEYSSLIYVLKNS